MKAKQINEITRQARLMSEFSKATAVQNVAMAVANGDLKIERNVLPRLLQVIDASFESSIDISVREFETQVSIITQSAAKKN